MRLEITALACDSKEALRGLARLLASSVSTDDFSTPPAKAVCDPVPPTGLSEIQRLIRTPKQRFHPFAGRTLGQPMLTVK